MAPPPLMEELVEEILLRFPPQEPASLVRAALVSKQWCRLISGPGFRRRFREFHRTPPMLGFFRNDINGPACFVPTTAFCPPHANRNHWVALDARHGRVLLWERKEGVLVVWDPITDEQKELPVPPQQRLSWAAAILCSAGGGGTCDHLDCHRGPFLVVFVGYGLWNMIFCTYSSDIDAWSKTISTTSNAGFYAGFDCNVFVGDALYFGGQVRNIIVKYNLESREISRIQIPEECSMFQRYVLTTMDEGMLGLATVIGSKLYMWSRKDGHEVDAGWAQSRVIELKALLPFDAILTLPRVVGFTDGLGTVFLRANNVVYTINLETYNVKKVCICHALGRSSVVPYMSFYTPALEAAYSGEEPSPGVLSA